MESVFDKVSISALNDTIATAVDPNMQIAVLMTCHNRREKTVACLRALYRAADRVTGVRLHVFLTDDGSADGTSKAVKELGGQLTVLHGSGDLFWNRGMVRAWEAAESAPTDFDAYLLLNDDTLIDTNALNHMIVASSDFANQAIVVGATRDPITGAHTYGGIRRVSRWHPGRTERVPTSQYAQEADTFNANCVLVPKYVYERIGALDSVFHHGMGDFDYGLRARAAGLQVIVASGTVGTCARNEMIGTWQDVEIPLDKRLHLLNTPKGLPRSEWRVYLERHGAIAPGLLAWLPTIRVVQSSAFRALKRN